MKKIHCDKCNKPIERIETHRDKSRMETVFKVFCHGETEETVVKDYQLGTADFYPGVAFAGRSLDGLSK